MGLLSVGVSGLNAANLGLMTTSHNISNASTPGYNRQLIVQGTNVPVLTGAGFIGQGTNVQTVKRVYDQFLSKQVLTAQTGASEMDSYLRQINQIDNLLADPDAGLSPAMTSFFRGVQEMAANPSSIPGRQAMLSAAQSLVARFQAVDQRMTEIRDGINAQIGSEVSLINSYAQQIAEVNERIIFAQAGNATQPPNDLLDQRDYLVSQLNKEVGITTVVQTDGQFNLFFGNGQPLVVGNSSFTLKAVAASDDPQRIIVAIQAPGGVNQPLPESQITGGTLGGLVAFRNESLDSAQNSLGRIAIALTQNFNDQHQLGMDLTGALGLDFFNVSNPAVYPNSTNTSGALVAATFTATAATDLTDSDYRLTYSAANTFTMTRLSDGATWNYTDTVAPLSPADALNGLLTTAMPPQGFSLTLSGTPNVGETFVIQPAREGARNMSVAITDPRNIAAAAPIRTSVALTNSGTGSISAGSVNTTPPLVPNPVHPTTDQNLQQAVTITFNNPPTTFNVTGVGTGNPVNVPYTSGGNISYNGWTIQISGAPVSGDTFSIGANANGVSDNRNGVILAALQTKTTMIGGTASYQSAYSQIVSQVGNKAREVETLGKAKQTLADQAEIERQKLSGVNLDEEAANLLRYQQAYQASAKMIDIAGRLFDELLAIAR